MKDAACYTLENDRLRLNICSYGAEMYSLYSKYSGTEYLWQRDARYWDRSSPILFPIVGRIARGGYVYRGRRYSISSPHGFAPQSRFFMNQTGRTELCADLFDSPELLGMYPFPFRLEVGYRLDGAAVVVCFRVRNRGDDVLYFSLGAHPGFRIPWAADERFEDFYIEFSESEFPERILLKESRLAGRSEPFSLKNDRHLSLSHEIFADDAIILSGIRNRHISIRSRKSDRAISMSWSGFEYLGLWKPPMADAAFLCVEPWLGLPSVYGVEWDVLDEKPGIQRLEPGGSAEAGYRIAISEP